MLKTLLSKDEIRKEAPQKGLEPYLHEFYDDRLREIEVAHDYLERQNFDNVKELAHKWKGYSAPYGFNLLGQLGQELEVASLNKSEPESKSILELIDQYMQIKSQYLEEV